LNSTYTVILGGFNDPHNILVYDWNLKRFILQTAKLSGFRDQSCCGALQNPNGQVVVAVAGGTKST